MHTIALAGCGKIAGYLDINNLKTHLGVISSSENLKLKLVTDVDLTKAKKISSIFKCNADTKISNFLDKNYIDILTICSPDHTHFELIKDSLDSNNPPRIIFVEKPICKLSSQFDKIKNILINSQTRIIVNHTRRFNPNYSYLKRLIRSGDLGELLKINSAYYGGWIHNACHIVDIIIFLFNEIPIWEKINNKIETQYINDPSLDISGYMQKSKAIINMHTIDENFYQIFDIDLWFTKGRITINDFGSEIKIFKKGQNQIGENILYCKEILEDYSKSEMQVAYQLISNYLNTNNFKHLELVDFESSEITMKSLWQASGLS